MKAMDDYKEFKDDKEIMDIIVEYNDIEVLLKEKNESKLKMKLHEVSAKYTVEKIIYNASCDSYPQDIYQNAINCMSFLNAILKEKIFNKSNGNL